MDAYLAWSWFLHFLRLPTLFILLKNAERKSIFSANQIKPYYFLMGHNILWHYQRFTISHWIFSASTRIGFSCHHFSTCSTFVITCFTSMYHFLHCNLFIHRVAALLLVEKVSITTYWQTQMKLQSYIHQQHQLAFQHSNSSIELSLHDGRP